MQSASLQADPPNTRVGLLFCGKGGKVNPAKRRRAFGRGAAIPGKCCRFCLTLPHRLRILLGKSGGLSLNSQLSEGLMK
jgi:hypothetical protein